MILKHLCTILILIRSELPFLSAVEELPRLTPVSIRWHFLSFLSCWHYLDCFNLLCRESFNDFLRSYIHTSPVFSSQDSFPRDHQNFIGFLDRFRTLTRTNFRRNTQPETKPCAAPTKSFSTSAIQRRLLLRIHANKR